MPMLNAIVRSVFLLGASLVLMGLMGCEEESKICTGADCRVITTGCEPACDSGQICIQGECVVSGSSCSEAGERCVPEHAEASGFVCMDWSGRRGGGAICSTSCAGSGQCERGSLCFALHSSGDASCQVSADCAPGKECLQGWCRYAACQPSECSGPIGGQAECEARYGGQAGFGNGARCVESGNGAHFCVPAGTRQAGEGCIDAEQAAQTQNYPATCATGLSCVDGSCLKSCAGAGECEAPQSCVIAPGESAGFCASDCVPFEPGGCPADQTCKPLSPGVGQCVSAGSTPAFSRCTPGEAQCEAGTLCLKYPGTGVEARCQPICDLAPGAASEDGSIAPGGQAARDATCPQPEVAPASLRIFHAAARLGAVDIYLDNAPDPLVESLAADAVFPAGATSGHALPGGRYRLRALPAGAPRSDLPLAEYQIDLVAGQGITALLAAPGPGASEDAEFLPLSAPPANARSAAIEFNLVHLSADLGAIDVVLIPAGADASDVSEHILLGESIRRGEVRPVQGGVFAAPVDDGLKLIVFAAGADRSDVGGALFVSDTITLTEDTTLLVTAGAATPSHRVAQLAMGQAGGTNAAGARYTCVELEDRNFGFCQQVCADGAADYGQDICQGEQLGCAPNYLADRAQWRNMCVPVGPGQVDARCDPYADHGDCAEGLYCQPIRAEQPATSALTGRCAPLCELSAPHAQGALGCEAEQACQPIDPASPFEMGMCGWTCEPDASYRDASCPAGLERCEPTATLQEDPSGQGPPLVRREQPFCAASGPRAPGENCTGGDCGAGSTCLFPRSVQTDFTTTLASPYFGGPGLQPVCMPACDPFDRDSAAHRCASGETCLFNAWNAEVGHCAPIVEDLDPLQRCTQPGLACGEDSICALNLGTPVCFRFCDYLGTDAQGAYLPSTCPGELRCEPLINDIGICQAPG